MDEPISSESFSKACEKSMHNSYLDPIHNTSVMASFTHKQFK